MLWSQTDTAGKSSLPFPAMLALQQRWWQGVDPARLLAVLRLARALLDSPSDGAVGGSSGWEYSGQHHDALERAASDLAGDDWYGQRCLTHAAWDVLNHCYRNGYWSVVECPVCLDGSLSPEQVRRVYDAAIATCLAQHTLGAVTPPSSPRAWACDDAGLDWSVLHHTERCGQVAPCPNTPCTRCGGAWRYTVGVYMGGIVRRCLHCGSIWSRR